MPSELKDGETPYHVADTIVMECYHLLTMVNNEQRSINKEKITRKQKYNDCHQVHLPLVDLALLQIAIL
jgi:hypothetical protein